MQIELDDVVRIGSVTEKREYFLIAYKHPQIHQGRLVHDSVAGLNIRKP